MTGYEIESTGNGATWTIKRLDDGATLFLQGDDAITFANKINDCSDDYTDEDVCAEYDSQFVVNQ